MPAGVLEVERDEVEHPEEGGGGQEHDARWSSGRAGPRGGGGRPWVGRSAAPPATRRRAGRSADHAGGDDTRSTTSTCSGPSETPYIKRPKPGAAEHEAGDVEARRRRWRSVRSRNERAEGDGGDAERQVDEEDPAPDEVGDQEAAEHRAEGRRHAWSGRSGCWRPAPARPVGRPGTAWPCRPGPSCRRRRLEGRGRRTSSVMFWATPHSDRAHGEDGDGDRAAPACRRSGRPASPTPG